ncbi:MAG: ATP-binding protein [Halanaerobiales bacterium]
MKTLFGKLLFRFILITLIIIIIMGFSLIFFFKGFYFSIKEKEIINNSQIVLTHLSQAILKMDIQSVNNWLQVIARQNNGQAWLINKDGYLVTSYPQIEHDDSRIQFDTYKEIFEGNVITQRVESSYFERPMLLIGIPLLKIDDSKYGLMVFSSVAGINSTIAHVQRIMIYSSLGAIFLALIISYTWSKSLSNPLKKMSKVALELSNGDFKNKIEVPSKDDTEVGQLANSINYMSSKLKTTIDELIKERNKLKHVLTGMEEGVLAIDKNKGIILINNSARELLNILKEKPVGSKLTKLVKNEDITELILESLEKEKIIQDEFLIKKNNIQKRVLIHCTPLYNERKQLWGVVILFQDISERWRFEQLQKDFVANVSHELKAPLSSIKGAGEILLDKVVAAPDKQEEYLDMIVEETDRLEELVNNILLLSKLDEDIPEYKKEKINANELLQKVSKIFKKTIETKDYRLKTVLPEKQLFIKGSEDRLIQVMLNLLDNACKFSDNEGVIELGVMLVKNEVKFWVTDKGKGIPENELENIWERFYKVDKAHTRDKNGSGLGLSIVKNIIEKNGGRVFVESKLEYGSTFGFYLPKV